MQPLKIDITGNTERKCSIYQTKGRSRENSLSCSSPTCSRGKKAEGERRLLFSSLRSLVIQLPFKNGVFNLTVQSDSMEKLQWFWELLRNESGMRLSITLQGYTPSTGSRIQTSQMVFLNLNSVS